MMRWTCVVCVASLFSAAVPAAGQEILSFTREVLIAGLASPNLVEAVDLDGDLDLDLIVADQDFPGIAWYENIGGLPTDPPAFIKRPVTTARSAFTSDARPAWLFHGDIDGDGDEDFGYCANTQVVREQTQGGFLVNLKGVVEWFENQGGSPPAFVGRVIEEDDHLSLGDGLWSPPPGWSPFGTLFVPARVIVADADNDTDLDLTVSILFQGSPGPADQFGVIRYVNGGQQPPVWTAVTVQTPDAVFPGDAPVSLVRGDLDNDTRPEFLWWDNDTNDQIEAEFRVENEGVLSSFGTTRTPQDSIRQYQALVATADLDQDGWEDVATYAPSALFRHMHPGSWPAPAGPAQNSFTPVFLGGGQVAGRLSAMRAVDLSNDGYPEIITTSDTDLPQAITVHENELQFSNVFVERVVTQEAAGVEHFDVGDLTGDGFPDLIVAARGENAILLYRQDRVAIPPSPTDFLSLNGALTVAPAGNRIEVGEGRFNVEPIIDYRGKAQTIASDRDAILPKDGSIAFPDGGELEAAPGRRIEFNGATSVDPGATATLTADRVVLGAAGSLTIPASTTLNATGDVELFGTVTLGPSSRLDSSTTGEVLINPIPALPVRRTSPTDQHPTGGRFVHALDVDGDGQVESISTTSDEFTEFLRYPGVDNADWLFLGELGFSNIAEPVDLTGNGLPDLVGLSQAGAPTVAVQGAPLFFAFVPLGPSLAGDVRTMVVGDLDGDGDRDVVVLTALSREIWWYESDGAITPSFTPRLLFSDPDTPNAEAVAGELSDLRLADIDGDGDLDAAVTTNTDVRWYENNGAATPSFTAHFISGLDWVTYGQPANNPVGGNPPSNLPLSFSIGFFNPLPRVRVADMDGDSDLDLVVSRGVDHRLVWLESDGAASPSFTERVIDNAQSNLYTIHVVDFDRDGDPDVFAAAEPDRLTWFENLGQSPPLFAEHVINDDERTGGEEFVTSIATADANGDGQLDVFESYDETFSEFAPGPNTGATNWYAAAPATITLPAGARIESSGDVRIARGVLDAAAGQLAGDVIVDVVGSLTGTPSVFGNLENRGRVAPDNGTTTGVTNNYSQSGELEIDLTAFAGGGNASRLNVAGQASPGGGLIVQTGTPLDPQAFAAVDVVTANFLVPGERFDVALLPSLGTESFLALEYRGGTLGPDKAGAAVSLVVTPLGEDVDLDPQATADSGAAGIPRGATLGDIDLDGDPDLLIALPDATNPTTANGSVVILYNDSDGNVANGWEGFGSTVQVTTGVGVNPSSVAVAPMDDNAQPDIIVSNRGNPANAAPDTVSVLLVTNGTAGGFTVGTTVTETVGDGPADVTVADLDGDGQNDIATANSGGHSVSIAFNAGPSKAWGGLISAQEFDLPDEDECPLSIRPGEAFFAKGGGSAAYLATANYGNNSLGLLQVNPDRTVVVLPNTPTGAGPIEVTVADFDLDGLQDVATVNEVGSSITVALNSTVGSTLSFGGAVSLPVTSASSAPTSITAGDFDSDASGDPDIAVLVDDMVRVYRNDLVGSQLAFTPTPDQAVGTDPLLLRSADLDGDGQVDVVTVAESTGGAKSLGDKATGDSVNILLAVPAPACAGDVTGDGRTDIFDFADLAAAFGTTPQDVGWNPAADLVPDSMIDVFDFAELAADFGCVP